MTLHKKDLIALAGSTLAWAAQNDCVKDGKQEHSYFTIGEWNNFFEHSTYTFSRVKREMVELGIAIAQRPTYGHYISDAPHDVAINIELALKNVTTRLETIAALCDSSQKSKHSKKIMARLQEVVKHLDIELGDDGLLTFSTTTMLPAITEGA